MCRRISQLIVAISSFFISLNFAHADDKQRFDSAFHSASISGIREVIEKQAGTWISSKHSDRLSFIESYATEEHLSAAAKSYGEFQKKFCDSVKSNTRVTKNVISEPLINRVDIYKYFGTVAKEACESGQKRGCSMATSILPAADKMASAIEAAKGCYADQEKKIAEAEKAEEENRQRNVNELTNLMAKEEEQRNSPEGMFNRTCDLLSSIQIANQNIESEKAIAKKSGVTNLSIRYRNGAFVNQANAEIEQLKAEYKTKTGKAMKVSTCP